AEFSEVFFDNVRVPKANLLGAKDQGWQVLVTTLMFERSGIGFDLPVDATLEQLIALARRGPVKRPAAPAGPAGPREAGASFDRVQSHPLQRAPPAYASLARASPRPRGLRR